MRKWQNLAPPDDPGSWFDVDGMWPEPTGAYATMNYLDSGTAATATGTGDPVYAFCAKTLSSRREYVVATNIFEYSAGAYTDRTGGVTVGSAPMMAQYGDVTVCAMGASTATAYSTGANFAALAGAPQAEIVLPVANALLYLNTNTSADGWATSDVGDYTNYTTGESSSGRLIQTPGAITAGVAFGNYAIVFKADAIYRITYVGGQVKWATELIYNGIGCQTLLSGYPKYAACSGGGSIIFPGYYTSASPARSFYYLFDGVSPPRHINPLTVVHEGRATYNPQLDMFTIKGDEIAFGGNYSSTTFFYSRVMDAWGKRSNTAIAHSRAPLLGDFSAMSERFSTQVLYGKSAANTLKRYAPGSFSATYTGNCYLRTSLAGAIEKKTLTKKVIAIYYRRLLGASASVSLSSSYYSQAVGDSTGTSHGTASQTKTTSESTAPLRFDVEASDAYADYKITWSDVYVAIPDLVVLAQGAGKY